MAFSTQFSNQQITFDFETVWDTGVRNHTQSVAGVTGLRTASLQLLHFQIG
jgi:hypothetical protein